MKKCKLVLFVFISLCLLIPYNSAAQWLSAQASPTGLFTTFYSNETSFILNTSYPRISFINPLSTYPIFGLGTNWISSSFGFANVSNPFSSLYPTFSLYLSSPLGYGTSLSGAQPSQANNLTASSPQELCVGLTSDGTPMCPDYDQYYPANQQPTFECRVETDKSNYRPDESVQITFIVKNTEDLPVLVKYASSKTFEISIIDHEGYQIWSSSYGMRYAQTSISREFKAKGASSFSVTWDQKDNHNTLAPPGTYTIEADWTSNYGGWAATKIILTAPHIVDASFGSCKETTDGVSTHDSGGAQAFRYEYADTILSLYHNDAEYNCCLEDIVMTMNSMHNVIDVYEDALLQGGAGCDCLCAYDLTLSIADVSFGSYEIRFFNKNTGELYGEISEAEIPCFKENEHTVINSEKFKKIRQFIIDQGQRATYCQMYNDNPYYQFSDNFKFYLNPCNQRIDMYNAPVDAFSEIVIQVMPAPLKYYNIRYDEAAQTICVRLSPNKEIKEVEKEIEFFFTEALKLIDNLTS